MQFFNQMLSKTEGCAQQSQMYEKIVHKYLWRLILT